MESPLFPDLNEYILHHIFGCFIVTEDVKSLSLQRLVVVKEDESEFVPGKGVHAVRLQYKDGNSRDWDGHIPFFLMKECLEGMDGG